MISKQACPNQDNFAEMLLIIPLPELHDSLYEPNFPMSQELGERSITRVPLVIFFSIVSAVLMFTGILMYGGYHFNP